MPAEGDPRDQLHGEKAASLDLFDRVDRDDRSVVEGRDRLRLPLEPGEAVRIVRERVRQDLQRDLTVELSVGGLPDLAHAPFADEGGHIVVPEAGASGQGHKLCARRIGSFYAQAIRSTLARKDAPRQRIFKRPRRGLRRAGGVQRPGG